MVVFDFSKEIEERDYISELVLSLWSIRSILSFLPIPLSLFALWLLLECTIVWSLSSWLCNYSRVLILHCMWKVKVKPLKHHKSFDCLCVCIHFFHNEYTQNKICDEPLHCLYISNTTNLWRTCLNCLELYKSLNYLGEF